jgi:hypothetical protein
VASSAGVGVVIVAVRTGPGVGIVPPVLVLALVALVLAGDVHALVVAILLLRLLLAVAVAVGVRAAAGVAVGTSWARPFPFRLFSACPRQTRRSASFLFLRRAAYPRARDSRPITSVFRDRQSFCSETVSPSSHALTAHQSYSRVSPLALGKGREGRHGTYEPFVLHPGVVFLGWIALAPSAMLRATLPAAEVALPLSPLVLVLVPVPVLENCPGRPPRPRRAVLFLAGSRHGDETLRSRHGNETLSSEAGRNAKDKAEGEEGDGIWG